MGTALKWLMTPQPVAAQQPAGADPRQLAELFAPRPVVSGTPEADAVLAVYNNRLAQKVGFDRHVYAWAQERQRVAPGSVKEVYVESESETSRRLVVIQNDPEADEELIRSLAELVAVVHNDPALAGLYVSSVCLPPCDPEDLAAFVTPRSDFDGAS